MHTQDIILVADYHDEKTVIRRFDCATAEERVVRIATDAQEILRVVEDARKDLPSDAGQVVWIMESTTGWMRVRELLAGKVTFVLANTLQMPKAPKAHRRRTDKTDTQRMLREQINGTLPRAYQPPVALQEIRRVVALRESLMNRRVALQNYVDRYLAHTTWASRKGLWSATGLRRLRALAARRSPRDRLVLNMKLDEFEGIQAHLATVEAEILSIYADWPEAARLDEILGIAAVSAVSILARIGEVSRFRQAEELIAFAGMAPGIQQSDSTIRTGRVGGGGTDKRLRHYVIEATLWARKIPRYQEAYERVRRRRGKKIARLHVGRLLLRSIYKMLRDGVRFDPAAREGASVRKNVA